MQLAIFFLTTKKHSMYAAYFFLGVLLALFFTGKLTIGAMTLGRVPCSEYNDKEGCERQGCTWQRGERIGGTRLRRKGKCVATA
jgi:hypothetical protein